MKVKTPGKTETIKKRAIYVYLPSQETTKRWKEEAKKYGSISKFVIEHVENSLKQDDKGYEKRSKLIKKIKDLEKENRKINEDNRILKTAFGRLDNELKSYRIKPFLEENFEGIRKYEKDLVKTLKDKKFIRYEEILDTLKINPKDIEMVKGVSKELDNLEKYGLIKKSKSGWRWNE